MQAGATSSQNNDTPSELGCGLPQLASVGSVPNLVEKHDSAVVQGAKRPRGVAETRLTERSAWGVQMPTATLRLSTPAQVFFSYHLPKHVGKPWVIDTSESGDLYAMSRPDRA
jgi:hypothetical protein